MKKYICMVLAILMMGAAACGEVYLPDFTVMAQTSGSISGDWGDAFLTDWGTSSVETAIEEAEKEPAELDKDVYFHEADDCYGKEGRKQVKKSKLPCPICVDDDISSRVTAKLRGGTVIVRVPTEWMERQDDLEKITFNVGESQYDREEGMKWLADALHGEDYCDFLEDWDEDGKAKAYSDKGRNVNKTQFFVLVI